MILVYEPSIFVTRAHGVSLKVFAVSDWVIFRLVFSVPVACGVLRLDALPVAVFENLWVSASRVVFEEVNHLLRGFSVYQTHIVRVNDRYHFPDL